MMDYTQILYKPVVSEKATLAKEAGNQVVFLIAPKANKIEVKQAVEKAFNVNVLAVNIVCRQTLVRRKHGRPVGRTSGFKKAYVTLVVGDKISFFEGV
ncbi:50S ribosomal subunit protein L23 [Desulfovibrionales bacterium]